jgi:hypothetical protein
MNGVYHPTGFPIVTLYLHENATDRRVSYIPLVNKIGEEAGCLHPDLFSSYLENLQRLKLMEIVHRSTYDLYDVDALYEPLKEPLRHWNAVFTTRGDGHADFKDEFVTFTSLGHQFCKACVLPKGNEN